ncbi:penicillin-binding transpeptidase domain-containing protein [Prosthecochloris sp. HL-130-GSB]|uniref:penicillin-binding transpeptidase domain-containing protein n=1 Tax=Prosthecochloris sp. HL-130-GSB TaxID=1974213 RepID=UPI00210143D8|nr:penicillin-binding transpeptidase domain-containing protein [Prosthecochloris sp. HL-130-GSB]
MPTFLLIPLILLIPFGLHAREIDRELLQGYETALVLCNRSTGETESLDAQLADRRQPPCSTFKIYNTLIGLELGLLPGPDDAWYQWDGVTRHYDAWNRDLTLRQAFSVSAVPAYQGLARQIGPERMKAYIDAIGYGSGISRPVWIHSGFPGPEQHPSRSAPGSRLNSSPSCSMENFRFQKKMFPP